ncbi:MAG TPA: hypothetical protein VFF06_01935 [Polyangia bacterium]|nr:hypothetical protein [Polyangia bacterium]
MRLTRLTLFYPATYLLSGGLAFAAAPSLALKLFFSNGSYGTVFPRFAGVLTFGLGVLVAQIIRHRAEALYSTVLWLRALFCAAWIALYVASGDPLFLILLGMVGFGFLLTASAFLRERRR